MDTSQVKTIFNPLSTICCRVASLWSSKFNSSWFLEMLPGPCISVGHSLEEVMIPEQLVLLLEPLRVGKYVTKFTHYQLFRFVGSHLMTCQDSPNQKQFSCPLLLFPPDVALPLVWPCCGQSQWLLELK